MKFATDDAPDVVIDVCTRVAADLPFAAPGEPATVTPIEKAKYEVDIPIVSPGNNSATLRQFRTRLWYAARRADLHLDGAELGGHAAPGPFLVLEVLAEGLAPGGVPGVIAAFFGDGGAKALA